MNPAESEAGPPGRLRWASEPPFPVPAGIALHLVPLRILAAQAPALRGLLDEGELARAAAIRHAGRSLSFRAGRAVARLALSHAAGGTVAPSAWRIVPDGAGKPRVLHPGMEQPGMEISIAHAGGIVGVAVGAGGEVGLDIEPLGGACHAMPPPMPTVPLHPAERLLFRSVPAGARGEPFLRLWTVKEAVAKCRGEGVAADFAAIDASPALAGATSFRAGTCDVFAGIATLDGLSYSVALAARR